MNKKKVDRNYVYTSWILLGLSIYVISFPIIARLFDFIFPNILQCSYHTITGNPCPLCGGTRYFADLMKVFENPSYLIHPFGIMAITILLELIFRISMLIYIHRKKVVPKKIVVADIIIHSFIIFAFILYEVSFFLK